MGSQFHNHGEQRPEPIAVIGLSCRFSGMASDQHRFWQLLSAGMTTWSNNAKDRFKMESFWHPDASLPGSTNSQGMHLLGEDPRLFDNDFFQISGIEAKAIDPQQRLLLEIAYEAFENAGIILDKLEGSNTGVYCASNYAEYDQILGRDPNVSPTYRFTGTGPAIMANRISYVFDLKGPSVVIDTACSSSLVALHNACSAIWSREVDQALVGGSNLILDPDIFSTMSSMSFLSPHGRCYAFDSRANGFGCGDGCAALVLKPLHAAIRDGDYVRAVIRGTAVGCDGKTLGITMPSGDAQYETIRRAYDFARLDPGDTVVVEAHGTGTAAGDRAEVEAFVKAFRTSQQASKKLYVGSVKSNIGHTLHTAGLAGVIKAILMLEHRLIVPNPTFKVANPALKLDEAGIEVVSKIVEWPLGEHKRVSVNSTGYGGTNAHAIVESADIWWPKPQRPSQTDDAPRLFSFTHQRENSFHEMAAIWRRFLSSSPSLSLDSLAYTLGSRRTTHSHRAVVIARDLDSLVSGLQMFETGAQRPIKAYRDSKVCLIFTGQGAQWARMGFELISLYPVFKRSLLKAQDHLLDLGAAWKLVDELEKMEELSRINEAELAQPCTTAIQIALVDLLASFNIKASQVVGHSSGEIAAAYALGVLSAADALKVSYSRGVAVLRLREVAPEIHGGMLAVGLSEEAVCPHIAPYGSRVSLACINSSNSVTLSGDSTCIDELARMYDTSRVFNRKLTVGVAYHSHHMKLVEDFYRKSIQDILPRSSNPNIQMASSVNGEFVRESDLGPGYWVRNLVSPVRFSDALNKTLQHVKYKTASNVEMLMIEVGPHGALRSPVTQILRDDATTSGIHYLSSLARQQDSSISMLTLMGELLCRGLNVSLNHVNRVDTCGRLQLKDLPSYNWHHKVSHWSESRRSRHYRFKKFPRHDLLGASAPDSISDQPTWHNYIRLSETPWLSGHNIDGSTVLCATGYLTMVVEAMRQQLTLQNRPWKKKMIKMKDIIFMTPLLVTPDHIGVEVLLQMRLLSSSTIEASSTWNEFSIFSISEENRSTEHCRGIVAVTDGAPQQSLLHPDQGMGNRPWTHLDPPKVYRELSRIGMNYSGQFACLKVISARPWETEAKLCVANNKPSMPSGHQQAPTVHPVTLDGCLQAVLPGLKLADHLAGPTIPASIDEVQISTDCHLRPGTDVKVWTKSSKHGQARYSADISATKSRSGTDIAFFTAKGVKFAALSNGGQLHNRPSPCYQTKWQIDPFTSSAYSISKHCSAGLPKERQILQKSATTFCRWAIKHALEELTPDEAAAVSEHRRHYLAWMRAQDVSDAPEISTELVNQVEALGVYGIVLTRIGRHLKDLITGEADALFLLVEDGVFYRMYSEREEIRRCHVQLVNYALLAKFKNPSLKILEVGGGTGSLTLPLLEALYGDGSYKDQEASNYVFTDVSIGFISFIREKLGRLESFVEFKALDIEQPVESQGFSVGSFDIIVASNVVHATRSLTETLSNLKTLLKPGGQLALVEVTVPTIHGGMAWGGIPGWWLGVDDGRTLGPTVDTSTWDRALKESGFTGVDVEMKDYEDEEHELSLLLSSVPVDMKPDRPEKETFSIIASDDGTNIANQLQSEILAYIPEAEVRVRVLSSTLESRDIDGTIIMLAELSQSMLSGPSESQWTWIRDVMCNAKRVLWVSMGGACRCAVPQNALITGLGRTMRTEHNNLQFYALDVDPESTTDDQVIAHILQLYKKVMGPHKSPYSEWEWEMVARDEHLLIPRIVREPCASDWVTDSVSKYHPRLERVTDGRSLRLSIRSAGLWDTLYWEDNASYDAASPVRPQNIRLQVEYGAINFKDIMIAMGQLSGSAGMLIEGAGTVLEVGDEAKSRFSVGDRVCFFEPDGLGTMTEINHNQACIVPQTMSLETAAAAPVAYGTVVYAIRTVARLQLGETILIHSAAGAVGQAAISIARHLGAKDIFVTVGNDDKRQFIKDQFGIPDDHIFSSRSLLFAEQVLEATGHEGVDVVLNSLSGEAAIASCQVLASFGRFVEIGKRDIEANARMQIQLLKGNKSFSVVDLVQVAKSKPKMLRELVQTSLHLLQDGKIQMIEPITVRHVSSVAEQLEYMQSGKHIGKLVLKIDDKEALMVQPKQPSMPTLNPTCSYLVVGGTGGLGKEVVRRLAKLGARRIITLSRSGFDAPMVKELAEEMEAGGVELVVVKGDVCDKHTMETLRQRSVESPIRGIIQGGMDLKDSLVKDMTSSQWSDGIAVKVAGTLNLAEAFATSGTLDFFILLGSIAAIAGVQGTCNYNASNTFMAAMARHYASKAQPFRAIDLGYVLDSDFIADNESFMDRLFVQGTKPINLDEMLAVLNYSIANPVAKAPDEAQIIIGIDREHPHSNTREAAAQRPDSRFAHIWSDPSREGRESGRKGSEESDFDALIALKEAKTPNDTIAAVLMGLRVKMAALLSIHIDEIQPDRSVTSYGVDSMIELQLRNWITGHLQAVVSMVELMSSMSLEQIARTIAQRCRLVDADVFATQAS